MVDHRSDIKDRRAETEEDKDERRKFAREIATETIESFFDAVYHHVGKTILEKVVWAAIWCLVSWYLTSKGYIPPAGGK